MLRVVVASKNPVKINAVKAGFAAVFPHEDIYVSGVDGGPGLPCQPMTDADTQNGAGNRVLHIRETVHMGVDFWVGIEGGIADLGHPGPTDYHTYAWVVIASKGDGTGNHQVGRSRTASLPLPETVMQHILAGDELGTAIDKVFGLSNSKQHMGAVGALTNGVLDRTKEYINSVILALTPWAHDAQYKRVEHV